MGLVLCRDCCREVSSSSKVCNYCSARSPGLGRVAYYLGEVGNVLIVLGVIVCIFSALFWLVIG